MVGDDRGPKGAAGAGATAALGGSPGTAAHQAVELQGKSQGHEGRGWAGPPKGWVRKAGEGLEGLGLAQSPTGMGALDRIVRRLPFPKGCQQLGVHCGGEW